MSGSPRQRDIFRRMPSDVLADIYELTTGTKRKEKALQLLSDSTDR